jgi:F-type H+-transporting ATPase subunit b
MLESLNAFKFLIVAVNLLILYLVLKKLLFKPVTAFMEKRTNSIKDSIDNAEKLKIEAYELKKKYEDQLRGSKDEVERILNEATIRANKEHDSIVDAAELKAASIIENANKEIERNKKNVLKDIKNQVSSLALAAATKVIEANMDNATNRALVDKFIDEEGAA